MVEQEVSDLIEKCLGELTAAQKGDVDQAKAEKVAALCLVAQIRMAELLADFELRANHSKNMIAAIEAEVYGEIKTGNVSGGKITESAMTHLIAKDERVKNIKKECAKDWATLKKYNYLSNTIKDAHYYFKSLAKAQTWT